MFRLHKGCDLAGVQEKPVISPAAHHPGASRAGDLSVHPVCGLKDGHRTVGAAIGQQNALDHLVGTVGREHLSDFQSAALGQSLS